MMLYLADELRLGLRGQVRRVLAPRGVKIVQRVQIEYRWRYLVLAVAPTTGQLRWQWLERFRQDQLKPVLAEWDLEAILWDGAGTHRGKQLAELATRRVYLPPYSPELNPVERVFQELRRQVEGRVYDRLDDKQAVVDTALQQLAADPDRVKLLCGWDWLLAALDPRPAPDTSREVA
ncbi:MAG TPA: transposase [Thermomicrobiaceae bacterium]|nr:transposase [Thermomicrobiaceae bacterium]